MTPHARVLWLSHEAPDVLGQGGQRRQYRQIEAIRQAGLTMLVLVPASEQSSAGASELVPVIRTPRIPRGTRTLARIAVLSLVVTWRPTAIVVAHAESFDLVRMVRRTGVQIIVDFHNVNSTWFSEDGDEDRAAVWRAEERRIAKAASFCTVCSVKEAAAFEEVTGVVPIVVANGVAAAEWPERGTSTDRECVVATFGSWWYEPNRRGLTWFVGQVWPLVLAEAPEAHFLVAGGPEAEGLLQGVPQSTSLGRVPDLAGLLSTVQVVVVPVLAGPGTPLKFGESLASGAAVVATPHAAASYAATDVCEVQDDPVAFAASCIALLQDPRRASALGEAGRRFALEHVEWRQTTQPLLELLQAARRWPPPFGHGDGAGVNN